MSYGESEAWELLAKAHFIYDHLPRYMQLSRANDTRAWLSFDENYSEIKALPSTDKAGRGATATLIIRDELAKHPEAELNYASILPAINSGGQVIDLSTIDKGAVDNHFTDRVERALKGATKSVLPSGIEVYTGGESGAVLVFLGWRLRPVRDENMTLDEWFEKNVRKKFPPATVEQEYPASLSDALRPPETNAFFDSKALEDLESHIDTPLQNYDKINTFNGMVRIYKPPVVGHTYVFFTDPSNGIEDPFVTVGIELDTGEEVASATGRIPAQEVGLIHDHLVRAYNDAYNTGEVNAQAGGSFADTLKNLGTPNIAPRRNADGDIIPDKVGWWTGGTLRDTMLHNFAAAVYERKITIYDRDAIDEMRYFIRNKLGKLAASGKRHDDWVMAWAGVWQIAKYAPRGGFSIYSFSYRV